jgi:DNA mismatch endonuclease (patch repair protein)
MPDPLTPEQRKRCMSKVKSKNTDIELVVRSELHRRGLRFRIHVKTLPGTPDIVFPKAKIAIFVDGDFWHGYRFPDWESKLPEFWRVKIANTRKRDQRNFRRLRRMGWSVIRIWQHSIEYNLGLCVERIVSTVRDKMLGNV